MQAAHGQDGYGYDQGVSQARVGPDDGPHREPQLPPGCTVQRGEDQPEDRECPGGHEGDDGERTDHGATLYRGA